MCLFSYLQEVFQTLEDNYQDKAVIETLVEILKRQWKNLLLKAKSD